jgi:hypothetical protein
MGAESSIPDALISLHPMKVLFAACLLALIFTIGCGHKMASAQNAASLDDLNRALARMVMSGGPFPPSTNELAKFLALTGKSMPVPPPGKNLVIDSTNRQFVFVGQ